MRITRAGDQPSARGPADWFTGTVRTDMPFAGSGNLSGTTVTFGLGRVQRAGGPVEAVRPGDVVFFEPGEKHWHGAAPDAAMSHIAIAEKRDGEVVTWMEKVSDREYLGSAPA